MNTNQPKAATELEITHSIVKLIAPSTPGLSHGSLYHIGADADGIYRYNLIAPSPIGVAHVDRGRRGSMYSRTRQDEDISTQAYERRHEPFELLEKAGVSMNR
jgi:hypothetical protein